MEKTIKDAGKEQRVVLNLNMAQAKLLYGWIAGKPIGEQGPLATNGHEEIKKISKRIEKTLIKQQIAREHPEFSKEQINRATKEALK